MTEANKQALFASAALLFSICLFCISSTNVCHGTFMCVTVADPVPHLVADLYFVG